MSSYLLPLTLRPNIKINLHKLACKLKGIKKANKITTLRTRQGNIPFVITYKGLRLKIKLK